MNEGTELLEMRRAVRRLNARGIHAKLKYGGHRLDNRIEVFGEPVYGWQIMYPAEEHVLKELNGPLGAHLIAKFDLISRGICRQTRLREPFAWGERGGNIYISQNRANVGGKSFNFETPEDAIRMVSSKEWAEQAEKCDRVPQSPESLELLGHFKNYMSWRPSASISDR